MQATIALGAAPRYSASPPTPFQGLYTDPAPYGTISPLHDFRRMEQVVIHQNIPLFVNPLLRNSTIKSRKLPDLVQSENNFPSSQKCGTLETSDDKDTLSLPLESDGGDIDSSQQTSHRVYIPLMKSLSDRSGLGGHFVGMVRSRSYPYRLSRRIKTGSPGQSDIPPFRKIEIESIPSNHDSKCGHFDKKLPRPMERGKKNAHRYYYTRTKSDKISSSQASSQPSSQPNFGKYDQVRNPLTPASLGLYSSLDSALDAVSMLNTTITGLLRDSTFKARSLPDELNRVLALPLATTGVLNDYSIHQTPTSRSIFNSLQPKNQFFEQQALAHWPRLPPPSLKAIRSAVNRLYRMDDFDAEHIGTGFFSEVFKVTHVITQETMVLKVNKQKSNKSNVLREIQLMNTLSHPNVLRFLGVCVNGGQLHALTEYLNGGNLEQLLLNVHTELTWPVRISLASDIARGVEYLHSHGIFHRDLTSKNCLIRRNDKGVSAVVGDLGLAAKIPTTSDICQHAKLPIVGSPYWMAPECLQGKYYDEKADIFSFGIILCEIIARIEADPDILPRTMNFGVDYMAFSEMCVDVPPDFLELAFKCCMVDSDCRPQSFKDIFVPLSIIYHNAINKPNSYNIVGHLSALRSSKVMRKAISDQNLNVLPWLHIKSNYQDYISSITECGKDKASLNNLSPLLFVNPQHVGVVMSRDDNYYAPSLSAENPFVTLLTSQRPCPTFGVDGKELFSTNFRGLDLDKMDGSLDRRSLKKQDLDRRLNFSSSTTDFDSGCSSESQDGDDDKPINDKGLQLKEITLTPDTLYKKKLPKSADLKLACDSMTKKVTFPQPVKSHRIRHPLKHLTTSHQLKLLRAKITESTGGSNLPPFKPKFLDVGGNGPGCPKISLNFFTSASCSIKAGIKKCFSCRPNTSNTLGQDKFPHPKFNV